MFTWGIITHRNLWNKSQQQSHEMMKNFSAPRDESRMCFDWRIVFITYKRFVIFLLKGSHNNSIWKTCCTNCKFGGDYNKEDMSGLSTKSTSSKVLEKLIWKIIWFFFTSYIIVFMRGRHVLHSFSLHHGFVPLGFPGKVFNEAVHTQRMMYSFSFTRIFPQWVFL